MFSYAHFYTGGSWIASEEEVKAARAELMNEGSVLLKATTVVHKKILGKPPRKQPEQTRANTLPPSEESVNLFFSCKTVDEFASLVEYLHLNGGWFPFQVQ